MRTVLPILLLALAAQPGLCSPILEQPAINKAAEIPECQTGEIPANRVPGIEYLGAGYDAVQGNPMPTTNNDRERGFRYSLFDLTCFDQGTVGGERRFAVPDGAQVRDCPSCTQSFHSVTIRSSYDYLESLYESVDINRGVTIGEVDDDKDDDEDKKTDQGGAEGGTEGGAEVDQARKFSLGQFNFKYSSAFRASDTYNSTSHETGSEHKVFIDTKARCSSFCYAVDAYSLPRLSSTFRKAVARLPGNSSHPSWQLEYFGFFEQFGTHFVASMTSGSLFWQRSAMSDVDYNSLMHHYEKHELEKSSEVGLLRWFSKDESEVSITEHEQRAYEEYSRNVQTVNVYSVGTMPEQRDEDGRVDMLEWQRQSEQRLMPINYVLSGIESLLTEQLFVQDQSIGRKRELFLEAVLQYCPYLAESQRRQLDCGESLPPTKPPAGPADHLKWVKVKVGDRMPTNLVKNPKYLEYSYCRATVDGSVLVGFHHHGTHTTIAHSCEFAYKGVNYRLKTFELLTNPSNVIISQLLNGIASFGAIEGGYDSATGSVLYVGHEKDNSYRSGYINPTTGKLYSYNYPSGTTNYYSIYVYEY